MSKKIFALIGVAVVLPLAYTGGAWYCGKSYESQAQQDLASVNQLLDSALAKNNLPPQQFSLTQVEFNRGIFSSNARYQLRIAGKEEGVPVVAKIQHGPFVGLRLARYRAVYELENTPSTNLLFKLTDGKSPLTIAVREGFSGAQNIEAKMPPFTASQSETQNIAFSGLTMNTDTNRSHSFFTGSLVMDSLSFLDGANKVDVAKLRSNFDLTYNGIYMLGKSDATVDSVSYAGTAALKLDKIKIDSNSKDVDKLTHSETLVSIANIQFNQQDFGGFKWNMVLDNFDMAAYAKMFGVGQQNTSDTFTSNVRALLVSKPILKMAPVEWETAAGKSTLNLVLGFKAPPENADSQSDWANWLEKAELKVDLSKAMLNDVGSKFMQVSGMDAASAAEQARTAIGDGVRPLLDQGILKDGKDNYSADIRFENGMVNLNGKSMMPDEFSALGRSASSTEGAASSPSPVAP